MKFVIYHSGDRDIRFYQWLGPYALDRAVSDEIHDRRYETLYDEPDTATWLFVLSDGHERELMGFCAIYEKPKEIYLDNSYVIPEYRGKGVGTKMFEKRLEMALQLGQGKPIKAITKSECQFAIYQKFGFELASKRGRYWWVKLEAKKQ